MYRLTAGPSANLFSVTISCGKCILWKCILKAARQHT